MYFCIMFNNKDYHCLMKQFELKFYREWYDALAEMSREERAEAALSLLEYAYEDKIPDDKFIRIATTLMRNKINREKSRQKKCNSTTTGKPSSVPNSDSSHNETVNEKVDNSENPENTDNSENSNNSEIHEAPIETVIHDHFSEDCQSFVKFCQNIKVDVESAKECARKFIRDWVKENPDKQIPIPVRKPGMQTAIVDKFICENAKPAGEKE